MRALLVDDSVVARLLHTHCLEQLGLEVTMAADGDEGLTAAESAQFQLIVTDLSMPKVSGLEMLTKIRALESYREVPVVVVSAVVAEQERPLLTAMGVALWIVKPLDPDLFKRAVCKLLGLPRPVSSGTQTTG